MAKRIKVYFLSHDTLVKVSRMPCSTSSFLGCRLKGQPPSWRLLIILSRGKEFEWVLQWHSNALNWKGHRSHLLKTHWAELVAWLCPTIREPESPIQHYSWSWMTQKWHCTVYPPCPWVAHYHSHEVSVNELNVFVPQLAVLKLKP
jgi:hypothetical protein